MRPDLAHFENRFAALVAVLERDSEREIENKFAIIIEKICGDMA